MLVVPIPTDRYLAHVVDAAKSAGYGALLVVLVRTADARDFHDAIIDDWTSLHDVTGDFVAVLCPDPKNAVGYYPNAVNFGVVAVQRLYGGKVVAVVVISMMSSGLIERR